MLTGLVPWCLCCLMLGCCASHLLHIASVGASSLQQVLVSKKLPRQVYVHVDADVLINHCHRRGWHSSCYNSTSRGQLSFESLHQKFHCSSQAVSDELDDLLVVALIARGQAGM